MTTSQSQQLLDVLNKYAVPDPKIVGKLPKGGQQLDFIGHADVTRILIEIDPLWSWEPIEWDGGKPAMYIENDMLTMWGRLTVHGKSVIGVGTVKASAIEASKQVIGDFIRNSSMRLGLGLSLWTKQEWTDLDHNPAPAKRTTGANAKAMPVAPAEPHQLISKVQITQFTQACAKAGLVAEEVGTHAGVDIHKATVSDLDKLRASFKTLAAQAKEEKE
jgi:hypothetical protein